MEVDSSWYIDDIALHAIASLSDLAREGLLTAYGEEFGASVGLVDKDPALEHFVCKRLKRPHL